MSKKKDFDTILYHFLDPGIEATILQTGKNLFNLLPIGRADQVLNIPPPGRKLNPSGEINKGGFPLGKLLEHSLAYLS